MTPEEYKGLAEQLKANPLFVELLERLEAAATERMFNAKSDLERVEAQAAARATRDFRADWQRLLTNNRPNKQVP